MESDNSISDKNYLKREASTESMSIIIKVY
jgi:hypothetical protein